jgi:hypothetical protein
MSGADSNEDDRKRTADGILEMLREAGVSTADLEDKKHAFWDTQVCRLELNIHAQCKL